MYCTLYPGPWLPVASVPASCHSVEFHGFGFVQSMVSEWQKLVESPEDHARSRLLPTVAPCGVWEPCTA